MKGKNRLTYLHTIVLLAFIVGAMACGTSLVIQNVDYSQPLESVLVPDSDNRVHDQRYAIQFSIDPVLREENVTSVNEVRLIRNSAGYYFFTAAGFSNVYILEAFENELRLKNKIQIAVDGLDQPAFNQRHTHIELVDKGTGETYNLDQNGRR